MVVDAFAANLSSGFLGALIVVVLVDRANDEARERERRRIERIAVRQLRLPIVHLVTSLGGMMKAAAPDPPAHQPRRVLDLLTEEHARHLDALDVRASAGVFPEADCSTHIPREVERIRVVLGQVVGTYLAFVGPHLVEAIEAVRQDPYLGLFAQIDAARHVARTQGTSDAFGLGDLAPLRRRAVEHVAALAAEYERVSGQALPVPDSYLRDDVGSRSSSARLV